jgi:uncharacterized membrane protein
VSRRQILEWAERGALAPDKVGPALALAGVLPDRDAWRRFISTLLIGLGALLLAAGVIFFFAYNWNAMGKFAKFGLAEALIAAAVIVAIVSGLDRMFGKASLFLASALTGALLALIGQTYQTGADPYQLFAGWAVLILPWVAVSRMPALWLLVVLLLNVAVATYVTVVPGVLGFIFTPARLIWLLFGLNTAVLAIWEIAIAMGIPWLQARWSARIVATASGTTAATLGLWAIIDSREIGGLAFFAYLAWLAGAYFYYRMHLRDLFVLAGGALGVIVVVTGALSRAMLDDFEAGGFLFIGLAVIGMSAGAAYWLRGIAQEDEV